MEKKIEDYLHLYIGCEVSREHIESRSKKFFEHAKLVGISASESEKCKTVAILDVGLDHFHEWYVEETIPTLRPLSDITEEESEELNKRGSAGWRLINPDKVYNVSLGVIHRQAAEMAYLLSKSFDLFGLIDAGLAIDYTKTNQQK